MFPSWIRPLGLVEHVIVGAVLTALLAALGTPALARGVAVAAVGVAPGEAETLLRVDVPFRKALSQCRIDVVEALFRVPRSAFRLAFEDHVARRRGHELAHPPPIPGE